MTDYNHLFELNELAIKDAARYPKKRELYHTLVNEKGKHFTGITGPRGVGKTVIMKQIAANTKNAFYLSRRVRLVNLYPFSFGEYIFFEKDVLLPGLTLDKILNKEWEPKHLRYEYLFEDYLKGGLLPFSLEEPGVLPLLENILQKILLKDIPAFAKLRVDEIPFVWHLLSLPPGKIQRFSFRNNGRVEGRMVNSEWSIVNSQ